KLGPCKSARYFRRHKKLSLRTTMHSDLIGRGIIRRYAPHPFGAVVAALQRSYASDTGSGRTARVLVHHFPRPIKRGPAFAEPLFICLAEREGFEPSIRY